ncbi:methionine aminopeptidase [Calidifontibacter sp. DB0510]|uniref:Methionine aminopeptidase n=1 Tax=Metallococcus carri TaxID=1656884 RepID=A0A967B1Y9_9MICO|nr:methionine aminopeptidase [Metallococcus carri]NHN57344.1 methionine aminopeptidase [Metallococcus carri]NOP39122.1 methionine aminopeptidase [Calidifontibacter sp. DB2511S]
MAYWYNVDTQQVEQDGETDPKGNLMGPYNSEAEARAALETSKQKNDAWDDEDREWNEGGRA